jgi:hypothetical protein
MPTDAPAGTPPEGGGAPEPADDDPLVFAAHHLGRDRSVPPPHPDEDAPFATAPRPDEVAPPTPAPAPAPLAHPPAGTPAAAGFLIRDLVDTPVPRAPVDALVVKDTPPRPAPGAIVPQAGFRIHSTPATPLAGGDAALPWTVRHPGPRAPGSPGQWSAREGLLAERSAKDMMRRLRDDAVDVSWNAAWIAVKSADPRRFKRRAR